MTVYKLVRGRHIEGGKEYEKGDIIESDLNLVKLWGAEKFRRLKDRPETPEDEIEEDDVEPPQFSKKAAKPARAAKPQPEKKKPAKKAAAAKPAKKAKASGKKSSKKAEAKEWDDVTEDFPDAEDGGLVVYKANGEYYVAEADDPESVIHKDSLTSKKQVRDFIESCLEE